MSPEFEAAYLRHVAMAFEKQLALSDFVGTRNWNFNMDSGQLTFAKQSLFDKPLTFQVQILGTASEDSNSWLWSWANDSVPDNLTSASLLLREKGELHEFSTPQFAIDSEDADDHRVALTSVGLLSSLSGCDAYYRGPYAGGAAFFLLRDPRLHVHTPDAIRIATFFPQLISSLSISNHRAAFLSYLDHHEIEVQLEDDEVRAKVANSWLKARFDELNRLADLQILARA